MIVAGIGCRRGVTANTIIAAFESACSAAALEKAAVTALATGFSKADEPGLKEAAVQLHLPLLVCATDELTAVADRLLSFSAKSLAATGSGSLSEASALAAAGTGARLVAPRFIIEGVTVAFATGDPS